MNKIALVLSLALCGSLQAQTVWRCGSEGSAACGLHQAVVTRPHEQRGHAPVRRARHGGRATVGDEAGQARTDAVVAQRVGLVGRDHGRVVREVLGVEPVVDAQVGCDARQGGQQDFLHGGTPLNAEIVKLNLDVSRCDAPLRFPFSSLAPRPQSTYVRGADG